MIKIITHGKYTEKIRFCTCPDCGCVFEFNEITDTVNLFGRDDAAFITCPECRKNINLARFSYNIKKFGE